MVHLESNILGLVCCDDGGTGSSLDDKYTAIEENIFLFLL